MAQSKQTEAREAESQIYTSVGGCVYVRWVDGNFPVELQIGAENLGGTYAFTPEDAYRIGSALVRHALDSGFDPDTGETRGV